MWHTEIGRGLGHAPYILLATQFKYYSYIPKSAYTIDVYHALFHRLAWSSMPLLLLGGYSSSLDSHYNSIDLMRKSTTTVCTVCVLHYHILHRQPIGTILYSWWMVIVATPILFVLEAIFTIVNHDKLRSVLGAIVSLTYDFRYFSMT